MPVEQGLLEVIVNVQWEGGLAVEFGDKSNDAPRPPDETSTIERSDELS